MPYLRVTKTPLLRKTPLGIYMCFPYGWRLETFSPIMEINESTEELLKLCDGTRTREEIIEHFSRVSGEPVEEIAGGIDEFAQYMVGEGVMEWREDKSFIEPIYNNDRPYSLAFDITSACNLNCAFCSVDSGTPDPDELTLDEISPFIEQVKKLKPSPFAISGGEPLLKKEILLHILKEVTSVDDIVVTVFTNGTLVTEDYAHQLYDAGLRIARVSLDGHTAEVHDGSRGKKGAFEKTVRGIEYLKDVGIFVDITSVISRINYQYLQEIKDFDIHIGDSYGITSVLPVGRGADSDILLNPEERFRVKNVYWGSEKIQTNISPRNKCHTAQTIYVTANGDIFPCFYLKSPEVRMGNIRENNLSEIYRTDLVQNLLALSVDDMEECSECWNRYYCGGGCRGMARMLGGSVYCPDPVGCESNKSMARAILDNGEENTKKLLQELLKSTKELC
ncbi:MAG: radical SAM protein [Theionarchaea archaeon]|nr:radical SAM protein [Theionarchaea archaeon]